MHLGVNGWPPVASHMACLLLGMALAHLARGASPLPPRLPKKGIVVSSGLLPSGRAGEGPARLGLVHLTLAAPGAAPCRLTEAAAQLLDLRQGAFGLTLAAAGEVPAIAKAARQDALRAVDVGIGQALPLCGKGPRVTYGSP